MQHGIYAQQAPQDPYAELKWPAWITAAAGYPLIVDVTFLKRDPPERFRMLAAALDIPFVILDCQTPEEVLRAPPSAKHRRAPSDPDVTVFEYQFAMREPLQANQPAISIIFEFENANRQEILCVLAVPDLARRVGRTYAAVRSDAGVIVLAKSMV